MNKYIRDTIVCAINIICNNNFNSLRRELSDTETYNKSAYAEYTNNKLEHLIRYIYANYKMLFFEANLEHKSADVDINKCVVTNKQFYIDNMQIFNDNNYRKSKRSTSGSTGVPFVFLKDNLSSSYMNAMMYNAYLWHGVGLGDKQARLWGRCLDKKQRVIQSLKDALLSRKRLSVFEFTDDNCLLYYNELIRIKPKYFYAYSNALYQFALTVERLRLDGRAINIPVAICTGEVLFDFQRDKIAKVFGCKVVNEYGSTENGIIAFECEYGLMHVLPTVNIEIINPDPDGFGEILITELNSRVLPFVRYKNGDIARFVNTECRCGRPYDVIEIKEGRIDDYICCPDGKLVYDAVLAYALKDSVIRFKAIQDKIDQINIYVIPNNNFHLLKNTIINKLIGILGNSMKINIYEVDRIENENSGKNRYFVSLLKDNTKVA